MIGFLCLVSGTTTLAQKRSSKHPKTKPAVTAKPKVKPAVTAAPTPRQKAESLFDQGADLVFDERFDEALDAFTEAIRLDSTYAEAYQMRGEILMGNGVYDRALPDLNHAVRHGKDNPAYFYSRANLLVEMRRFEQAIPDYDRVLALKPDYAEAWLDRASAKGAKGDTAGACTDVQKAESLGLKSESLRQKFCVPK